MNTTDPKLTSWVPVEKNSNFPIQNLPFGIFKTADRSPRAGVAIGNSILDLNELNRRGYFKEISDIHGSNVFEKKYLNDFIPLGKPVWKEVRERIAALLGSGTAELRDNKSAVAAVLVPMDEAEMLMPIHVPNYTDFYSSIDHATNVGKMFRDPENALLPNWKHLPVGYHGRASSIVISGTTIHRPKGQMKPPGSPAPVFGPTRQLDFELEMAFVIGKETRMGESISTAKAGDHIFGMLLFNDWSARDIQAWEYVPLGPFLSKNFASSVSPWIVTMEALEPYRVKGYEQEPAVLPYLAYSGNKNIDINLEVLIQPENQQAATVCRSNYKYMYWTMEQQLAHHTVNGCNVQVGDLIASGTISGPDPGSFGSMLEITWKGTKPVKMPDGSERKFIHDYDTVILRGYAEKNGVRIGFGEVKGKVLPAK